MTHVPSHHPASHMPSTCLHCGKWVNWHTVGDACTGKTATSLPSAGQALPAKAEAKTATPVMRTTHCCWSVSGALRRNDRDIMVVGLAINGRRLTDPREVRFRLRKLLDSGVEVLPLGERCDGFDDVTGCPGHPPLPHKRRCRACGRTRAAATANPCHRCDVPEAEQQAVHGGEP